MCDGQAKTITDEFRLITGKKKTRRKIYNGKQFNNSRYPNNIVDEEIFLRRLKNIRDEMKISKYFINSISLIDEALSVNNEKQIQDFVCLGIGSFTTCVAALHQFAFSLEICDYFKIKNPQYYDPIFSENEKNILQILNCNIMAKNCEGKYTICGENVIILYLPHCPKQLINNFLWHNWNLESLKKSILICNSFEKLIENIPERILQEEVQYVKKIVRFSKEFQLENCYQYQDIFNDTSIHIFGKYIKDEMIDFWIKGEEPKYSDIELITEKMQEELNM